jgi:hypothetical protein
MPEPIEVPNWDLSDVVGLLVGQAVRHRALVELLIDKGVITQVEMENKANTVANTERETILAGMDVRIHPE